MAERYALLSLETPIMIDKQDAVAGGNAQYSEEADDRAQRDNATAGKRRQHPTSERDRERQESDQRQAPAIEASLKKKYNPHQGGGGYAQHALLGASQLSIFPQQLRVVLKRELDPLEPVFDFVRHRGGITPGYVGYDIDVPRNALVPDDRRFIKVLKEVYGATGEQEKLSQLEERERLIEK